MISNKVIEKHLEEIEYKYIACETNINNLKDMQEDIEWELKVCTKPQMKTLEIQKEQLEEQLKTNERAMKMHEKNIIFLKDKLWN